MSFLTINYSLNQIYFVTQEALLQTITNAFKNQNQVQLLKSHVILNDKSADVDVKVEIEFLAATKIWPTLAHFAKIIDDNIKNLINTKAQNIQFQLKGDF